MLSAASVPKEPQLTLTWARVFHHLDVLLSTLAAVPEGGSRHAHDHVVHFAGAQHINGVERGFVDVVNQS